MWSRMAAGSRLARARRLRARGLETPRGLDAGKNRPRCGDHGPGERAWHRPGVAGGAGGARTSHLRLRWPLHPDQHHATLLRSHRLSAGSSALSPGPRPMTPSLDLFRLDFETLGPAIWSSGVNAHLSLDQGLPVYQPIRGLWQTALRSCRCFLRPPCSFRTAGFPQYRLEASLVTRYPSVTRSGFV